MRKRDYILTAANALCCRRVDGQQDSVSPYRKSVRKGKEAFRTPGLAADADWIDVYEMVQTAGITFDILRFCCKRIREMVLLQSAQ